MAKQDFLDVLDDCIDRMAAGETIDDCLRDYPQHETDLRALLQTGMKVKHAYDATTETGEVEARLEEQLRWRMRSGRGARRSSLPWAALAAVIVMVLVGGTVILGLLRPSMGSVFSNVVSTLNSGGGPAGRPSLGTPIAEATGFALADVTAVADNESILATSTWFPPPTPTPAPGLGGPGGDDGGEDSSEISAGKVMQTATAIYEGYLAYSPTPEEVSIAGPAGTALPPTSLPDTGGDPVGTLMPTALPPTGSSTPPPTATAMASPDPNILPTSVAGMGPMTGTPTPFGSVGGQGEQFPSPTPASLPDLIPLNAGEIDDNADWDRYLEYRVNFLRRYGDQVIDVDVTGRERIRVVDADGFPVLGAMVQVFVADQQQNQLVAEMRTYATGETLFFPNARQDTRQIDTFLVQVTKGGEQAEFTLRRREKLVHEVVLGQTRTQQDQDRLDVLFLLDSTSSMTDEIFQLQSNILHISSEIDDLPGDVDVRYGLVAYRDWGNFEYVTRAHDFTPDVATFQNDLNRVEANSGDNNFDWPEALNESLHLALHDLSWRGEDTVKLVFLVSDARPHLNHAEETHIYTDEMVFAAQQGIKIHPIASSGLEPPGEYIFRQIAQYTMGRFIFLTYESSQPGAPGDLRRDLDVGDPDTQSQGAEGDYSVERLDELVLRLITDELAALHADNA